MWPRARTPDPELLALFEASGRNVREAAVLLRDLLAEYPERAELAHELVACEDEGDRLAHDILHRYADQGPRAAGLDSADVHALAGALDDVVDFAEEVADQLGLYGVEATMEQAHEIAEVLVGAAGEVLGALLALRREEDPGPQLVEIHRLENEADKLVRSAVASLFATGIDPMMVIRWKDIFDTLESAVDACETVANVLEGITLRRAR